MYAVSPSEQLYRSLRTAGVDFAVSVPCKLLAELIEIANADDGFRHIPVSREEEGLGILAGAYMAGRRPAIFMQNSGIGNSVNAIHSLLNYYEIPVVFVISHRGSEGEPVEAQRPMGNAIVPLARAAGVTCLEMDSVERLPLLPERIDEAFRIRRSVAFLCPFGFWG